MKILPYFCDEATNPGKQWLAHLDLGKDIYMSFFGANKDEAIERAERWYAGERAKHRVESNTPASAVPSSLAARELMPKDEAGWNNANTDWSNFNKENYIDPVTGIASDWSNVAPKAAGEWLANDAIKHGSVSDHKLSGSVWVLNRATGHRARIAANELASYEEKGYIKGGPRSK